MKIEFKYRVFWLRRFSVNIQLLFLSPHNLRFQSEFSSWYQLHHLLTTPSFPPLEKYAPCTQGASSCCCCRAPLSRAACRRGWGSVCMVLSETVNKCSILNIQPRGLWVAFPDAPKGGRYRTFFPCDSTYPPVFSIIARRTVYVTFHGRVSSCCPLQPCCHLLESKDCVSWVCVRRFKHSTRHGVGVQNTSKTNNPITPSTRSICAQSLSLSPVGTLRKGILFAQSFSYCLLPCRSHSRHTINVELNYH